MIANEQMPTTEKTPQVRAFGAGFILGALMMMLVGAYPLYTMLTNNVDSSNQVSQGILDKLQMKITLAHSELESIDSQLAALLEAEEHYSKLIEQKFDLETNREHLRKRLHKLETNLATAEKQLKMKANQFDRISDSMQLN